MNDYGDLVSEPIHISAKLKEAPAAKQSIFGYDVNCRAATDYTKLVKSMITDEIKFDDGVRARNEKLEVEKMVTDMITQ